MSPLGTATHLQRLLPPTLPYSVITPSHNQQEFAYDSMIIKLLVKPMMQNKAAWWLSEESD